MLENYGVDNNGVIYQIDRERFQYDQKYIDKSYNAYGILNEQMSYLRLGFAIGAIGHVPESVLDVGYGNGAFLAAASKIIKNCYGADIPPSYPLPEGVEFVEDIYSRHFEVVTFFDSLEHFENIYEIEQLNCEYIVISVPWCHYVDKDWFNEWKHRKPNEHLWHFNLDSLRTFMKAIGFDYIEHTNIEDAIRRPVDTSYPNILTAAFGRIK